MRDNMIDTKTLLALLKAKGLLELLKDKGIVATDALGFTYPKYEVTNRRYSPDYTDIYDTDDTHIQDTDEETMRIERLSKEELKKYIQEQTERLVELVHPRR